MHLFNLASGSTAANGEQIVSAPQETGQPLALRLTPHLFHLQSADDHKTLTRKRKNQTFASGRTYNVYLSFLVTKQKALG